MADSGTVCSMCGDVGFPDKLFQCMRCLSRFQHSYCSNYFELKPSEAAGVCDWCLSKERSGAWRGPPSKKHAGIDSGSGPHQSGCSNGDKPKRTSDHEETAARGKSSGSSSSSKPSGRRYKLLKDVLC